MEYALFVGVGSDSWVRGEDDRAGGGNVNAGGDSLQAGLLLGITSVYGHYRIAERREKRRSAIFLPGDSHLLTGLPGGSASGLGDLEKN